MAKILENYVQRHFERPHTRIKSVCEVVHRTFGTNGITYMSVSNEGRWVGLNDRPDWSGYCAEFDLYQTDPFLYHPSNYQNSICLWSDLREEAPFRDSLIVAKKDYKIANGLSLIQRSKQGCEFMIFTAPPEHPGTSLLFNELPWLEKFAAHFKKELSPLLKLATHEALDLAALKGESFFTDKVMDLPKLSTDKSLLIKMLMTHEPVKLTKREKESLQLYLEHKNMELVADKMKLSVRTIEFYLANIKDKLGCTDKLELILKGAELKKMGLLP